MLTHTVLKYYMCQLIIISTKAAWQPRWKNDGGRWGIGDIVSSPWSPGQILATDAIWWIFQCKNATGNTDNNFNYFQCNKLLSIDITTSDLRLYLKPGQNSTRVQGKMILLPQLCWRHCTREFSQPSLRTKIIKNKTKEYKKLITSAVSCDEKVIFT